MLKNVLIKKKKKERKQLLNEQNVIENVIKKFKNDSLILRACQLVMVYFI